MVDRFSGILNLSSSDKKPYEDNSDVTFYLSIPDFEGDAIGLSSYSVFCGLDNININNRVAVLETAGQSYPVILNNGNYNYENLRSEIQTRLTALGLGAFTVTLTNNRYNILSPVPIKFITNPTTGYKYDWASMISLPKDGGLSLTVNGGSTDILYTNKLKITSPKLMLSKTVGDYNPGDNNVNNVLGIVYLDNTIEPHQVKLDYANIKWMLKRTSQSINQIVINILDSEGLPIPRLSDGSGTVNWDLQIRIRGISGDQ